MEQGHRGGLCHGREAVCTTGHVHGQPPVPNLPSQGPLHRSETEDENSRKGSHVELWGGRAHPHFVVDQVEHGTVGDPVQGQAGQPLPQRLQQLLDRRPAGQQLSEGGPRSEPVQ